VAAVAGTSECFAAQPRVVTIEAARLESPLALGQPNVLNVEALVAAGWHINSDHPPAAYLIPTRVSLANIRGFKVGEVVYPPARDISPAFEPGQRLSVFTSRVRFAIPITALSSFDAVPSTALNVQIDYQACNDYECLRPDSVSKSFPIALLDAASTSRRAHQEASGISTRQDLLPQIFRRHGYILGFAVVLLGGLALNLTPCVYPLIGVTIAYFGLEGGGPRKVVVLAMLYVLGIALTFSTLGVGAALSGGLFGGALQNPYVLATIAGILLVLAAASFGMVSLQPPVWLMRRAGSARRGYAGALMMGLGMGVVAAPCIGPIVLGLLLMVQRSASAILGFALFFTLAVGLGLPYIGLALAAGSVRRLPRSGEWLAWVEQLFGFVLAGLALYLIEPLVPGRLAWRILPYYAIAAAIFLAFVSRAGRNWQPFFVFRSALGIIAVGALCYLLIEVRSTRAQVAFQPFDSVLLQTARADRKPVVLDFSADWCIPCREMEHTTFTDPAVVQEASNFVWLKANLTSANPRNTALMKQFEVAGVPTAVFIDSSGRVRASRAGYIGPREFLGYLMQLE
jgi:thiol:disulfide interchange protein DsbD